MNKLYLTIAVVLLVALALGCSGNDSVSDNTPQSVETEQTTPASEPTKAPEVKTEPVVVATFNGSSTKDTETFHVPSDQFKISWDTKAGKFEGNFIFTIKNADGSFKAAGANVIGTNSESTIVRGAGDYYLSITATQPYTITVETM